MGDDWLSQLSDDHYLEVGRAVTSWGKIESLIYEYIRQHLHSEDVYNCISSNIRAFDQRCDLMLALAKENARDNSDADELKIVLSKAKTLSKQRNKIAHNPIRFWLSEDDSNIVGGIIHSRTGQNTKLDIQSVKNFANSVHELQNEIVDAVRKAESSGT